LEFSNPTIVSNLIVNNVSTVHGGGIWCTTNSDPAILNNTITGNSADGIGGGIGAVSSAAVIAGNVIFANRAIERGGGIYSGDSNITIINNVVSGNSSEMGGGIDGYGYSPVINTILWDNWAEEGQQIYGDADVSYCDVQGGWEGEGNIDVDPLFRDPDNSDFHLMSTACGDPYDSPCIDAGHPNIFDSLLDCSWGLGEPRSDMGAYGGNSVIVGIENDEVDVPNRLDLAQNYPNPFNAATVIRYALPEPADVRIDIYDLLGRKVETLVQKQQPAGYHQVTWDAAARASGLYFYRIQAGEYVESRKMVLLK
jgi:hypothetical protein